MASSSSTTRRVFIDWLLLIRIPSVLTGGLASLRFASFCALGVQDLAHLLNQHVFREGFMEELSPLLQNSMPGDKAVGVARDIQHPHARLSRQHPLCESSSIHARHDYVSQQQVDFPRVPGFQLYRLLAILRREHSEAMGYEEGLRQFSKGFRVLDQQDCF